MNLFAIFAGLTGVIQFLLLKKVFACLRQGLLKPKLGQC